MAKIQVIKLIGHTKDAILGHPTLNCHSVSALSQILNFKRNNLRALEVRNYAMNFGKAYYIEWDEENNT